MRGVHRAFYFTCCTEKAQAEQQQLAAAVQGAQQEIEPAAVPAAATPSDEVEPDVAAGAAAPAAAPDATVPDSDAPVPDDEEPGDVAPEPAATGEAVSVLAPSGVDLDEAAVEAPAPATAAAEEATVKPNGGLEKLLYTEPGTCPKPPIEYVPAGKHEAELTPPVGAIATYGDKVGANGKFPLPYDLSLIHI